MEKTAYIINLDSANGYSSATARCINENKGEFTTNTAKNDSNYIHDCKTWDAFYHEEVGFDIKEVEEKRNFIKKLKDELKVGDIIEFTKRNKTHIGIITKLVFTERLGIQVNVTNNNNLITIPISAIIEIKDKSFDFKKYLKDQKLNDYNNLLEIYRPNNLPPESLNKKDFKLICKYNNYHNFVELGSIDKDWNFKTLQRLEGQCNAFTWITRDLKVYVPKMHLLGCGYTIEDLKIWLEFLKNSGINFEYKLEEESELPGEFSMYRKVYPVLVKGSRTNNIITYFRYVLLRYLFDHKYYFIPAAAIQLKSFVGDNISNFKAILMAHYVKNIPSGNALTSYPNINIEDNLSEMSKSYSLNSFFNNGSTISREDINELSAYFMNKDFNNIIKLFEKYENKK